MDGWMDGHSVRDRSPSLCKISDKSVQQFRRTWVPNKQIYTKLNILHCHGQIIMSCTKQNCPKNWFMLMKSRDVGLHAMLCIIWAADYSATDWAVWFPSSSICRRYTDIWLWRTTSHVRSPAASASVYWWRLQLDAVKPPPAEYQ